MPKRKVLEDCGNFIKPDEVSSKLCKTFNKLQLDEVSVTKAVKQLQKLHEVHGSDDCFFGHFTNMLKLPLSKGTSKDRLNTFDEKIFEVVCQFATSFLHKQEANGTGEKEKENGLDKSELIELPPFLRELFDWLLDHHEVESSGARLKVCMLINRLLKLLGEEAEIDDELYHKIFNNMLERLKDKVAEIRAQAVHALQRLQDPRDSECPIIKAFIFHLGCDPSPVVRKAIVRCIGATRYTLPHVIKRTMDVDENVRKAAYKFIADKVHIRSLSISKREEIIRRGLTDRNENVRNVVAKELVPAWLRFCNESIVELLYALDVGNSDSETPKEVLSVLFQGVPFDELVNAFQYLDGNRLIPLTKLSPETATYWRNLASYLHNEAEVKGVSAAAPYLENVLPELVQFCAYIRQYLIDNHPSSAETTTTTDESNELIWLFNGRQLIDMVPLFDLADVAGRNHLLALVKDLLLRKNVPFTLVKPLMQIHRLVQTNPQQRIQDIAEIIAELRDPMKEDQSQEENLEEMMEEENGDEQPQIASKAEKDRMSENQQKKRVEIAQIKVKLNVLRDELEDAIRGKDFMKAQELQLEINEQDENIQQLQEELALMVVPRSTEKKVPTMSRTAASQPSQKQSVEEDPIVVHKCLVMLSELMHCSDITSLNATLQTVMDEFIVVSLSSLNNQIKNAALKACGSFCLRSLDAAKRHILLMVQMAHLDSVQVRMTALESIFDLLMWYGAHAFVDQESGHADGSSSANIESLLESQMITKEESEIQGVNPIVALLSKLLDDRDLDIRTKVTEGLCKLMMSKVIASSKLFTRLILMWYNPVTDANGRLRHILGAFFPLYASIAKENQDTIEEAFLPTLKTLSSAPVTSPLNDVDLEDVGLFLIQLTDRGFLQNKDHNAGQLELYDNCHDSIAYSICNFIISDPHAFHVKTFIKLLNSLRISPEDYSKLKEFKALYQQMNESIKEKLCLKMLDKFGKTLEHYLAQNPKKNEEVSSPKDDQIVNNQQPDENTADITRKKRALFSQTCNTLLESADSDTLLDEPPSIKALVAANDTSTDENDEVFPATPKVARIVTSGELEITRVEESPLLDSSLSEELVSGNLSGMSRRNGRRGQQVIAEISSEGEDDFPTTSTQINRNSSKRLALHTSSEEASTDDDDLKRQSVTSKRSSRGKPKPVEPPKPQRKSRRLDSSTGGSTSDDSIKTTRSKKRAKN